MSSSAHSPGPVGPAAPSQGRHPQSFTCVYRISRAPAQRPGPSHPGCPGVTIRFPPGGGEHHQDPRRAPILSPPPSAAPSEHRPCRCGGAPSEAAYVPPSQWGGPAGRLVWFQVAPERWARCWAEGACVRVVWAQTAPREPCTRPRGSCSGVVVPALSPSSSEPPDLAGGAAGGWTEVPGSSLSPSRRPGPHPFSAGVPGPARSPFGPCVASALTAAPGFAPTHQSVLGAGS